MHRHPPMCLPAAALRPVQAGAAASAGWESWMRSAWGRWHRTKDATNESWEAAKDQARRQASVAGWEGRGGVAAVPQNGCSVALPRSWWARRRGGLCCFIKSTVVCCAVLCHTVRCSATAGNCTTLLSSPACRLSPCLPPFPLGAGPTTLCPPPPSRPGTRPRRRPGSAGRPPRAPLGRCVCVHVCVHVCMLCMYSVCMLRGMWCGG